MSTLRSAWSKVDAFWLAPVSVHHVVVLRIGFGLIMFFQYLMLAPYFEDIFGSDGLVSYIKGPSRVLDHSWLIWGVLIVASLSFTLGLFSRMSGFLLVIAHNLLHMQTKGYAWGDGGMGHTFILYTCLTNPGARLSLDAWIERRAGRQTSPVETVPGWPVRLLQIHLCVIYFLAAWNRIYSQGWLRGRMTFVALSNAVFSRLPGVDWIPFKAPLWLATWYTLILEAFAPVMLWWRKSRTFWVLGLVALHIGLELSSTITWWQFYMLTALTTFMPTRWLERFVTRFERFGAKT